MHPDTGGVHEQRDAGGVLGGDGPHHGIDALAISQVALLFNGLELAQDLMSGGSRDYEEVYSGNLSLPRQLGSDNEHLRDIA